MNLGEQMQYVSDLAEQSFAGITTVDAIVPIEETIVQLAGGANNDFLAAVADHIYYLEFLTIQEVIAITGLPLVTCFDIAAVVNTIASPNLIPDPGQFRSMWCTRLRHNQSGASAGSYICVFNGFDITFTA